MKRRGRLEDRVRNAHYSEFCHRLRRARLQAHMSQGDLGKRLDIHRTVWGRIERGFGGITVERLLLVAQLLKVSPLWLLGDDGKTLPDLTPRS